MRQFGFGRKQAAPAGALASAARDKLEGIDPRMRALMLEAEQRRASDPMAPLQGCARILLYKTRHALTDAKGVRVENLLAVLGSLAGYACLAAVARRGRDAGKTLRDMDMLLVETPDGSRYFYGEAVNDLLLERRTSVASLLIGLAQKRHGAEIPDLLEIVRHVADTLGEPGFGIPRIPAPYQPSNTPLAFVRELWPHVRPILEGFCVDPNDWPLPLTFAAMMLIEEAPDVIDPGFAALTVLECAIPMAKIDPALVPE